MTQPVKRTKTAKEIAAHMAKARHLSIAPLSVEQIEAKEKARTARKKAKEFAVWAEAIAIAKPGDVMPDKTLYLGNHQDKDWFVAAEDAKDKNGQRLLLDFNAAAVYAQNLTVHGHDDWTVPAADLLGKMYFNRCGALADTYSKGGGYYGHYWSSTATPVSADYAEAWDMQAGIHCQYEKKVAFSVRCVRAVPGKKAGRL